MILLLGISSSSNILINTVFSKFVRRWHSMLTSLEAAGFWKVAPHLIGITSGLILGITDREN